MRGSATEYEPILSGAETLDRAYALAKANKDAAASLETRMAQLRTAAPDLADQVVEERLTLDEALAALTVRRRQTRSGARASIARDVSRSGRRPRVAHDAAAREKTDQTVIDVAGDDDGAWERARQLAYYSARLKAGRELILLKPEVLADLLDEGHKLSATAFCDDMPRWCTQLATALHRGIHIVKEG